MCGGRFCLGGCPCHGRGLQALDWLRNGRDHGECVPMQWPTSPGDLMSEVIDRLVVAMNAHDLDAVAGFIHEDYRSEQPVHPGRAFAGRAQMLANWEAMFAGSPASAPRSAGRSGTVIRPGANGAGRVPAATGRPLRCVG